MCRGASSCAPFCEDIWWLSTIATQQSHASAAQGQAARVVQESESDAHQRPHTVRVQFHCCQGEFRYQLDPDPAGRDRGVEGGTGQDL